MYAPGTKLKLKEPKGTEDKPNPYDEIVVVCASPQNHGVREAEWGAEGGAGVIVAPVGEGFDGNLDEPMGKLQALYEVTEIPDDVVEPGKIRKYDATTAAAGATPEQQFASGHAQKVTMVGFGENRNAPKTDETGNTRKPRKPAA